MRYPRGSYTSIRVDGSEETVQQRPTIAALHRAIGCDCMDSVCLSKTSDGQAETVMMVDDTGMIDGKPVNPKATELYHAVRIGTPYSIHGIAVIVNDEDFA